MSILIRGMKMPAEPMILILFPDGNISTEDYDIGANAKAIGLPPHGDLIDYNFCLKNYELLHDDDGNPVYAVRMRDINAAPAIIEAEEVSE